MGRAAGLGARGGRRGRAAGIGLPGFVADLSTLCQADVCPPAALTPAALVSLASVGLTVETYAASLAAISVVVAIVFTAASGLLVWRRPTDRFAVFAAFTLLVFGAVTFPGFSQFAARTHPWLTPLTTSADLFGRVAFTLFLFVFPNGRFVPRWTRWIALAWILVQIPAPFVAGDLGSPARVAFDVATLPVWGVSLASAAYAQIHRYRHVSTPIERQQTRWTAGGFVVALCVFGVLSGVQQAVPPLRDPLPNLVTAAVAYAAISLIPISIAIALLWHGLFDVDTLIGRTLIYSALTVCVVGIYILIVGYLSSLFRTTENLLISLLGTGTAAALFEPLRERLQRIVNRLLYGQRDEPYAVLSDLARRVDATPEPVAILSSVVETVARALKLPYAAIQIVRDGMLIEVTSVGSPGGELLRLPLRHQTETVGQLTIGRRGGTDRLEASDRRLLEDLARQAAAAVAGVQLAADLQRSRERLVNAREEERRRIRRDLHDGLGPTLAALALKLEAACNRVADDPVRALLADLAERAQQAVGDIRQLVYSLRPPALDELGLVRALRRATSSFQSPHEPALQIALAAPDYIPPLPAAAEVAAYRIVLEALTKCGAPCPRSAGQRVPSHRSQHAARGH